MYHYVFLLYDLGDVVEDSKTLMDLGVRPHGTIQLEMSSTDPQNYPIKPIKPQQEYNMPDVITVRVQKGTLKCSYINYLSVIVCVAYLISYGFKLK